MKRLAISAIMLLSIIIGNAQATANISFKDCDDPSVASMLRALNGYQIKATIKGTNPDARFYELWLVKNHEGQLSRKLYGFIPAGTDSTEIVFTSIPSDSLNAYISTYPPVAMRHTMHLPTASCILIECVKEGGYAPEDTIPLVAYSTGKPTKYDLGNGAVVNGFDICGVRYSGTHPSQWHIKFGIRDCYYMEAIPAKAIDYTKLK